MRPCPGLRLPVGIRVGVTVGVRVGITVGVRLRLTVRIRVRVAVRIRVRVAVRVAVGTRRPFRTILGRDLRTRLVVRTGLRTGVRLFLLSRLGSGTPRPRTALLVLGVAPGGLLAAADLGSPDALLFGHGITAHGTGVRAWALGGGRPVLRELRVLPDGTGPPDLELGGDLVPEEA